jgi:hypothetical protein
VNAAVAGDQSTAPGRTSLAACRGGFAVAWQGRTSAQAPSRVFVRRFDPRGHPLDAADVFVDPGDPRSQTGPVVAPAPDGGFLVAWEVAGDPDDGGDVRAVRFDADGKAAGPATTVDVRRAGTQRGVAATAVGGGFAVAWESGCTAPDGDACIAEDGDGWGIFVRRLDADGRPGADPVRANQDAAGSQTRPAIGGLPDVRVGIAWRLDPGPDGKSRIVVRLLDPATGAGTAERAIEPDFTEPDHPAIMVEAGLWDVLFDGLGPFGAGTRRALASQFRFDGSDASKVTYLGHETTPTPQRFPVGAVGPVGELATVQQTDAIGSDKVPPGPEAARRPCQVALRSPWAQPDDLPFHGHAWPGGDVAPSLAILPDGQLVVVWTSREEGTGDDVFLRRSEMSCFDGADNDGDGLTDCADPDCIGRLCT